MLHYQFYTITDTSFLHYSHSISTLFHSTSTLFQHFYMTFNPPYDPYTTFARLVTSTQTQQQTAHHAKHTTHHFQVQQFESSFLCRCRPKICSTCKCSISKMGCSEFHYMILAPATGAGFRVAPARDVATRNFVFCGQKYYCGKKKLHSGLWTI